MHSNAFQEDEIAKWAEEFPDRKRHHPTLEINPALPPPSVLGLSRSLKPRSSNSASVAKALRRASASVVAAKAPQGTPAVQRWARCSACGNGSGELPADGERLRR